VSYNINDKYPFATNMKKQIGVFLLLILLYSCADNNFPDVSAISADLHVQRFEKDFFRIDTNNVLSSINRLEAEYPYFIHDFIENILGLPPLSDTSKHGIAAIKQFLSDYRPLMDSAEKKFPEMGYIEREVEQGLKFVKFYFPLYKIPGKLITFIGPIDGYGDVITSDALAVGLQLHMGSNFSMYNSEMGQSLYPIYISRKFTPETIPVNCIMNVINDMFPEKTAGKTLLEQMVDKGKRQYVLDKLLPHSPDTLKIGYTSNQLKGCYKNEGLIWNFFLTNSLLLNNEPGIIKSYVGEAPNTPEFGAGSPGNIGTFIGSQIVKKYMDKNPSTTLPDLMHTDAKKIYEECRYRPK